jgi:predicted RNase H-like HicB family nuclease
MRKIAAYIEKDPESGLYVGIVPGIPGAHTQGETLDELRKNLQEVLELCLEEMGTELIPEFVGIQEIEVGK